MSSVKGNSGSSKDNSETVKKVAETKIEKAANQPAKSKPVCTKTKWKDSRHRPSSPDSYRKTQYQPKPRPLPDKIKKLYGRKHVNNYTENERKRRQAKKLEYANQVGWMERKGRHRHAHQARREKEFINFMNGLPLDWDMSD